MSNADLQAAIDNTAKLLTQATKNVGLFDKLEKHLQNLLLIQAARAGKVEEKGDNNANIS